MLPQWRLTDMMHVLQVVTAATAMQPKSEHSAGEVKAAAGESASKTHATAPAAPGLPREAPVIGVRTLLEFVAWTVSTNAQDSSSKPIKGKTGDQLAGRKGAVFLTEELSAVGVAVRRMQV